MSASPSEFAAAVERWLTADPRVRVAILFGSSARTQHEHAAADDWSDLDLHVVTTDAAALERVNWPEALPDQEFCFQAVRPATGGVRKATVLFKTGQLDLVLVPLKTAQERLLGITYLHNISVQIESESMIDKVQTAITALLRTRHHLPANVENDFSVRNMTALMSTMQETTGNITAFLGGIAAISLVVGGIGIMNIMLVSVTERTREIGIRKALGATFANILLQFLIEAVVISVTGGLVGIVAGVAGAEVISRFAGWSTVISWYAILAAFGVSVSVGLFFGLYPARKAALLDPIEALRYE